MNDQLIRTIILRILEEPEVQQLMSLPKNTLQPALPEALVLFEGESDKNILFDVLQHWGKEYTLSVLPKDAPLPSSRNNEAAIWPEGLTRVSLEEALRKKNWAKLLIPDCSADTLAKAALGIQDTPFAKLIGWGICNGIPITLSVKYLGFSPQTPSTYRELYQGYLQQLSRYGVKILTSYAEQETICFEKKLLTDKDVFQLKPNTVLSVGKGTIISPMARDTLKRKQIELKFETEGQL